MGRYRKAVFVVTYAKQGNKVEYLILKRKLHWKGWEFPKGGLEPKETYRKCILRELKEETGLKPVKINWFCERGKYKYHKKVSNREGIIGQSYILVSCEVKKGKVKIDNKEHSGYKWLGFEQAVKTLRFMNQKNCLRIVDKWLSKK